MAKFAIQTLEFDKVKEMLAGKTATSLGRERVMNMRIESDFASVKRLQEETAEALRLLDDGKRFPFGGAYNILSQVKRARIGSVLEPEELMQVGTTCEALRMVKQFLADEAEIAPQLAEYAAGLEAFPKLERLIASTVSEKGEILDSASTKLAGLRTGVQVAKNRVREKLDSILHDPNNQKYFQDALVTMRGDRYVIPIKQEYRYNFPGVVHDQSGSGATLFIEPMAVVNLNNDIKRYLAQEQEEIERILRSISGMVGADAVRITQAMEQLTELDFIAARAYLAQQQKAVRPVVNIGGGIEIAKGRHPLLDPQKVVPLDIEIGGRFNTLLITGPNTGGKTVALKTVGLFMLMVQAGLFVPAVSAKMPVIGAVYADIGDEQSIEQSLSTFSGHMTNMVEILKQVKAGELVLIDELCAGTDPNEGAALAMSILEHLHKRGVLTIVTTHYSELKTFAYGRQGMENASVEFDPVSLRPTYRLLMGVPGSSNAFNISRRLGLDDDIIENTLFRRSRTRQGVVLIFIEVAHAETHIPDYNLARFDAHRMSAYTYTGSRSRLSGNRNTVFGNIEHSFQHDIAGYGKNDGTCAPFFYGTTKRTLYRRLAFIIVFECCHYIYFAATAAYGIFAITFGSGESGHLRRRCLLRPCAGKRKQGTKQNYKVPFHNDRIKHILLI